jgi:PAS domain S-box-containing protein
MLQDIGGREGIQTFVSDQWLLITGYTREELLDSCFFDLVAESDRHGSIERHRMKMSGISVPGSYKMKIRRKDGLDVVVEVTGAFTNYLGKRSNVLYIRDITERILAEEKLRDSEDRYHSLFDEVPVAIWELDYSAIKIFLDSLRAQGINIRNYFYQHPETTLYCLKLGKGYGVNQAAVELWDAESTEELVNGIFDLIQKRPGGLERDRENIIAMAEGATEINYVNCDPTFKGELKYTSVKYRIAPGHENDWSRVFGSFFDITERIEAEKELQAYQEHLKDFVDERTSQLKQEVSRSRLMEEKVRELYNKEIQLRCEMEEQINRRIRFTRAVVHELKTPLTPLLGATELLAGNLREDPWDKLAQQSHRGALELNRRIDDLFDLTRNEIGTLKLNYTWADPITIVQQLIDITNLQCQASGHVLCLDIPDSLPQVYCDPQRLKQVLNNLIDNACKYTQPGTKIMLHISLENNALLFRVEDSGPGIAEDKQKEIFAPYSKIEKQREHYSGLGLGLSICKTFVNLHGGEIFLESKPGAGSCFAFTIPISGRDSTR